jgi:hypothetical protein
VSTIQKRLADVDASIARLGKLKESKERELQADSGKHALDQKMELQERLRKQISRIESDLHELHERRFETEMGDVAVTKTAVTPAPRSPRQWQIKAVPRPPFPEPGAEEAAVGSAWNGYLDHHVAELQKHFKQAGIDPDRTLSAELISHMLGEVHGMVRWHRDAFAALKKRVDELESAPIKYRGVWQKSDDYRRGHVVTDAGSAWHAVKDVPPGERPGVSDCWQLMVKAGRDGR